MTRSDAALLAATARGDEEAFAAFFRRHEAAVTRFAIRRCDGPDDVADAVAETFLAALRAAPRYRAEHVEATPWLLGIAVRVLLRQRRSLRRRVRLGARVAGTTPRFAGDEAEAIASAIDAQRTVAELEQALERLPRRERAVLELVAFADLTPTEAASALGVSANAARLRLTRARRRLREALEVAAPGVSDLDTDPDPELSHAR